MDKIKVLARDELIQFKDEIIANQPENTAIHFLEKGENIDDIIGDYEVIWAAVGEALFKKAVNCKYILSHSTGLDWMNYPALRDSDVTVSGITGVLSTPVAEHAVTLLLSLCRNLHRQRDLQREGRWKPLYGMELEGATAVVVGLGSIGRKIATRLKAFDMNVLAVDVADMERPAYVDRLGKLADLDGFLKEADAVVLSCPSTPETRGIISEREFGMMKDSAYLVNISRGDVVNEQDMIRALTDNAIAGAGIDVTATEPCPAESPLWTLPNCILTPHSAAYTANVHHRKAERFMENLKRYAAGTELINLIDKQRGY